MVLLPDSTAPCALPDSPLAAAKPGIDACVHCGFCLQACPTYVNLEDENDSPRGRILLMRSVLEGTLPADDADVRTHIDRCLGCRACETACPSGVPYGHMLEATRATLYARRPAPLVARVILAVFARRCGNPEGCEILRQHASTVGRIRDGRACRGQKAPSH